MSYEILYMKRWQQNAGKYVTLRSKIEVKSPNTISVFIPYCQKYKVTTQNDLLGFVVLALFLMMNGLCCCIR